MGRKVIFCLNIDDYAPSLTELTYPRIRSYAKKIGADFKVIQERRYLGFPVVYEKLQIHELGRGYDWILYIDSDALIHPDAPDFTQHLSRDAVAHVNADMASIRFQYDQYFLRDGRNIGSANWFTIASGWCLDLWTPLDIPLKEAVAQIHPTVRELAHGVTPDHLIDDYTLSRNIARFGLKFDTISLLMKRLGMEGFNCFFHSYLGSEADKLAGMKNAIQIWEESARESPKVKVKDV